MLCVNVVFIQKAFIFSSKDRSESESYIALGWVHRIPFNVHIRQ